MPPLIAFAGALGGLAVVRWAYKTAVRINRELEEARLERVAEAARANEIPTLRRGPVTGAYRPGLPSVIPGREANPESRDSGFDASHRPGMTLGVSPRHRLDS